MRFLLLRTQVISMSARIKELEEEVSYKYP